MVSCLPTLGLVPILPINFEVNYALISIMTGFSASTKFNFETARMGLIELWVNGELNPD